MPQKQFATHEQKVAHKPIRRPPVGAVQKKVEDGDKRPFTTHLPPLIQRAAQTPQSITPAEVAYLQRTVGNQALGRMLRVQRQEEDEELQMKPSSIMGGGEISPDIEDGIQRAEGGGRPLSPQIRTPMEQNFGADFSGVKIHTDGQSDQLNQSIQARAFTTGRDIFFRDGAYNPDSSSGQELLAQFKAKWILGSTG